MADEERGKPANPATPAGGGGGGTNRPGEHDPTDAVRIIESDEESPLRFGTEDTGPLPHWTEPPTGEVPKILPEDAEDDDLEAWSGLSSQGPVWRDDRTSGGLFDDDLDFAPLADGTRMGALNENAPADHPYSFDDETETEAAKVTPIRTRSGGRRPGGTDTGNGTGRPAGRNMPVALGIGVAIGVVALILFKLGAKYTMVLVVAALVLAGVELYEKLRERGYQPATLPGLVAIGSMPLAAYWRGEVGIPVVLFMAFFAIVVWFMLSGGLESGPLPNTAVSMLGIVFVGFLGAYAALILRSPDGVSTLLITALGVVAYDVFGLLVGRSSGRTPLAPWISPNKTVEGLVGGVLGTILVVILAQFLDISPFSKNFADALQLGAVIAVAAPLGDLTCSMFKRNLDIKDFGTLLPGHGGVLDRFCDFLLVLPAVYYLGLVIL